MISRAPRVRRDLGSLRARLLGAFLVLGLALLVGLGAGLFVLLRDLHREAASATLADVIVPVAAQARVRLAAAAASNAAPLAERARRLLASLERPDDVSLFLVAADGRVTVLADDRTADTGAAPAQLDVTSGDRRGDVTRGVYALPDGTQHTYVATNLFGPNGPADARTLVVSRPDDAARLAAGDLGRLLPLGALVLLLVGVPLAWWLAQGVTRPLERLSDAAAAVGRGELPPALPVDGPQEAAAASRSFNAMTAEVAHARSSQVELLANLRHDLRTPLTVIAGFAQALGDGTATGPDAARAAGAIAGEAARMERMVEDLADLDQPGTGGRTLHLEELDAGTLARDAAARFSPQAAQAGQTIGAAAPEVPLPLMGDAVALERVLGNLVANAFTAAPRPGGHVIVEAAGLPHATVMLAVRDDGPGIAPAVLPRVFERFVRGDPSRSGRGSGLGLAIVARLAEAHGGRAFAENLPGGGGRVGVTLPGAGTLSASPPPASAHRATG